MAEQDVKKSVQDKDTWLRLAYLILFGFIIYFCSILIGVAAVFQFVAKLLNGSPSKGIVDAGNDLATYFADVTRYMTFASDEKPFPFAPLPNSKHGSATTGSAPPSPPPAAPSDPL